MILVFTTAGGGFHAPHDHFCGSAARLHGGDSDRLGCKDPLSRVRAVNGKRLRA
jgi:hypothetical protein